jgi:signal transduction histidine kinase
VMVESARRRSESSAAGTLPRLIGGLELGRDVVGGGADSAGGRRPSRSERGLALFSSRSLVPLVGGCLLIALSVIAAWELGLSLLGRTESDPFLRWAFILRAVVASALLAFWAAWYVARLHRRFEAVRAELESVRAEEAARARRAQEEAGLGATARLLAHEIRAPLHGIALRSAMLRKACEKSGHAAPELAPVIETLERETARVDRLLSEYMAAGGDWTARMELAPVALDGLVREAAEELEEGFRSKEVRLSLELAPALPRVEGNAGSLKQAMVHLLSTALEAVRPNGEVLVRGELEDERVALVVEDDGLELTDGDSVFRPFARTRTGDSGLKLAIVRDVVRAHGGEVSAGPRRGGGARILLRLPAVRSA